MWKDWCPLCGHRYEANTSEELIQQILDHAKGKDGEKSECEKNWRPFEEALADDHY